MQRNEFEKVSISGVSPWIAWFINLVVFIAQNWETIKPPIGSGNDKVENDTAETLDKSNTKPASA